MSFLYVRVYHGPDNRFLNVCHKPQKFYGFRDTLRKMGYRVDLVPVNILNYVMIEVCDHQVFRCNMKNLKFNTSFDRDPISVRAIDAVMDASVKFRRARAYLWFWTLIEMQQVRKSEYGPQDVWIESIDIDYNFGSECLKCLECCDLRLTEIEDKKKWEKV